MKQGTIIVIDGADGSGKATQTKLLAERLLADGHAVKQLDFPQYEHNHFGKLLRRCLDGQYGDFAALDPHIASVLYAGDRFESSQQIRQWLEEGAVVLLDRYVSSNMLHQGAKISDDTQLKEFLLWLDTLEHSVFSIPRPDLIMYLDVPYAYRQKLLFADSERAHLDTVETNVSYQEAAETNAQRLLKELNNWHTINCVEEDTLLSIEAIHKRVHSAVSDFLSK